jgi:predicted phosphodiesterase
MRKFENVKDICLKYLTNGKEYASINEIARDILDNGDSLFSIKYVAEGLSFHKKVLNGDIITIDTAEKVDDDWKVVDDNYIWKTSQGQIQLSVDIVDQIFYKYSSHGENLSQSQIINLYSLSPYEWNSLKTKLSLTKLSNIFSPYTFDNTPISEREKMVEDKMNELHSNAGALVEKTYRKSLDRFAKKAIQKNAYKELFFETFFNEYLDLPKIQTFNVIKSKVAPESPPHIVVFVSDLHIGAKIEGLKVAADYDSDIIKGKLSKLSKLVNSYGSAKVTVALMGDFIESFTGLNHENSWQSMEHGMYGARAYWNAVDIISAFLGDIINLDSIIGVSGNHDRGDSKKSVDPKGEIGLMLLEQLKRSYEGVVEVTYDSLVVSVEIDSIRYILGHGDDRFINGKASEVIVKYGDNRKYNVIASAHLHSFLCTEDTATHIRIKLNSIFTGNYYSESSGFSSQSGAVIFKNNGEGVAEFDKKCL